MRAELVLGDCLEVMRGLPDASVDMVLCDLPYGTTRCKWDSVIPFAPLWEQYERVARPNAAIVLTASQPFTAALVMSNVRIFRYSWIWEKSKASNFLDARRKPLKAHEDIVVFAREAPRYFPVMTKGEAFKGEGRTRKGSETSLVGAVANPTFRNDNTGERFPRSVQYFKTAESEGGLHPTQKPIALMEYLIRTYTEKGETVLDNAMGSGTTGVACTNTARNFIGIEKDPAYFEVARVRIGETPPSLFSEPAA